MTTYDLPRRMLTKLDPNEALRVCRIVSARLIRASEQKHGIDPDAAVKLAEHFLALDGWLKGKGFLPQGWKHEET